MEAVPSEPDGIQAGRIQADDIQAARTPAGGTQVGGTPAGGTLSELDTRRLPENGS